MDLGIIVGVVFLVGGLWYLASTFPKTRQAIMERFKRIVGRK